MQSLFLRIVITAEVAWNLRLRVSPWNRSNRHDWNYGIWSSIFKLNLEWTWVDSMSLGFVRYMSDVSVSNKIILSVVAVLKNFRMHTSTWGLGKHYWFPQEWLYSAWRKADTQPILLTIWKVFKNKCHLLLLTHCFNLRFSDIFNV